MKGLNYWIMSDPHFGHDMLVKKGHRPEKFEEMIIRNLWEVASHKGVIICLGDFAFYKEEYWHQRFMEIPFKHRWLILGNHDRRTIPWYLEKGWDSVSHGMTLKIYGKTIHFSHEPLYDVPDSHLHVNIHGHLHTNPARHTQYSDRGKNHILIKMEHDYKPLNLRKIVGA